jgi:ectoine hydroxylase-related dioxygenase (phytanoyl-CoA dioxygenase family)
LDQIHGATSQTVTPLSVQGTHCILFVLKSTLTFHRYGGRQTVHADMAYNFPQMPCTVTANYYLKDASPANGSTELWLGSSRDTTFRDHKACRPAGPDADPLMPQKISLHTEDDNYAMEANFGVRDDCREARRSFAPPIQPSVKGGSVMLRDLRLWHAGIANPSNKTRIMLNFIHTPWWYQVSGI